jgi:hypothetical protein
VKYNVKEQLFLKKMENTMRNLILAAVLLCGANQVSANQCNVEIDGNLQLENAVLSIKISDSSNVVIDQNKNIFVDGEQIVLTAQQQLWVNSYYDGIYAAVPEVAGIAKDAIALASDAVNQAFGQLLGKDHDALVALSTKIEEIGEDIQHNFYAPDGSIRIHSEQFKDGDVFSKQWQHKFEQAVEALVTESIGGLMVAVGTEMIFSGGDMDAFEQRMEKFGRDIEAKVEYQSAAIEAKAKALCATLASIDYAENKLQLNIAQLAGLDVLEVKDYEYSM